MIQNNIKTRQKDSGFTIVELLVVIVVIGILAAITIVSYTGFTARAKASQAQSNANSAMQVISTYTADSTANNGGNGTYPANVAAMASYNLKMPAGVTVSDAAQNKPDNGEGQTVVRYMRNAANTGGCIGWWDYADATPQIKYLYLGAANTANFTLAVPTCGP